MRAFTCDNCGQIVFFENDLCLACRAPLGYVHERRELVALAPSGPSDLVEISRPERSWRRCATAASDGL